MYDKCAITTNRTAHDEISGGSMGLFNRYESPTGVTVSVLVPVYNVERYLPECLDSLKAQTLKNMEFICINDGSTDSSLEILKRYAAADSRFVIIDKPNSGYGASMNCGLDRAQGEYIGICESDDFVDPQAFKTLYRYAKRHDLDLVKANYYEHDESGDVKMEPYVVCKAYKQVFDPRDDHEAVKCLPIIWAGLYRHRMLTDNGIRFNETPGASFQDTSFVFRCWVASHRVALLQDAFLHYRVDRAESSVKSGAKIYEVCGEYAMSEAFLREDPQRLQDYGALMNVMKFDTYRWNYNRIDEEHREGFAQRWAEEYRAADREGLLVESVFRPEYWALAQELMADPEAFSKAHSEL